MSVSVKEIVLAPQQSIPSTCCNCLGNRTTRDWSCTRRRAAIQQKKNIRFGFFENNLDGRPFERRMCQSRLLL